jgi:hypothetical protein
MAAPSGPQLIYHGLDQLVQLCAETKNLRCPTQAQTQPSLHHPPLEVIYCHPRPPYRTRILPQLHCSPPYHAIPFPLLHMPPTPSSNPQAHSTFLPDVPGPENHLMLNTKYPMTPPPHDTNNTPHKSRNESPVYHDLSDKSHNCRIGTYYIKSNPCGGGHTCFTNHRLGDAAGRR